MGVARHAVLVVDRPLQHKRCVLIEKIVVRVLRLINLYGRLQPLCAAGLTDMCYGQTFNSYTLTSQGKGCGKELHCCWGLRNFPTTCNVSLWDEPPKFNRLVGLVVKASTSRAEDPRFESRLRLDFSGVESYQ